MRKLATAAAVSLALASGGAFGLGLGDIEMRSALNQPMNAEIRLTSVKSGELDGMIVQLASADAFARAGIERSKALTDLRFIVDQSSGVPIIRISSQRPVVEPFLNFLVEVDWPQGRMVREYTVLLDPPVFMTPTATNRNATADQSTVVERGTEALIVPTPINRDEVAGGENEGEIISLDTLPDSTLLPVVDPVSTGDIVSLTDLNAPNSAAIAERDRNAELENVNVELVDTGKEVSDSAVGGSASTAVSDGSTAVSLDGLSDDSTIVSLDDLSTSGSSASGGSKQVTVGRGDTLYEIAERNPEAGASVQQMMMALLAANESAFINKNINLVRAGSILRIPAGSEVRQLSQSQALAAIGQQNQLWQEYRDKLFNRGETQVATGGVSTPPSHSVSTSTATETAALDLDTETTEQVEEAGRELSAEAREILEKARNEILEREELRIVADNAPTSTTASATADETADNEGGRLGEVNRKLQLAREELASTRLQSEDLTDQVGELQGTAENLDSLMSLRQNEIAQLESQLADARTAAERASTEVTEAGGDALTSLGNEVADGVEGAVDAAGNAVNAAGNGAEAAVDSGVNALTDAGETLGEVELIGEGENGEAEVVLPVPRKQAAWYEDFLNDPKRMAIAGVGAAGMLGVLGTLLFRRRRDDDEELLDIDNDMEFIGDEEAADLEAELRGDGKNNGINLAAAGAAAGAATIAANQRNDQTDMNLDGVFDDFDESQAHFEEQLLVDDDDDMEEEDLDKDDTISEVDVYLAYGLHGQAEELLVKASEQSPNNKHYAEKLLETYHAQGNSEGFHMAAREFHAKFGGEANPAWASVAAMGAELRPGDPLYVGGQDSAEMIGGGHANAPVLDDEDFLPPQDGAASSFSRDFSASEHTLDNESERGFDPEDESGLMDSSLDPAFAFDEDDLEATGDFSEIANEIAATTNEESLEFPSFEAENTITGGIDAVQSGDLSSEIMNELPEASSALSENLSNGIEFDMPEVPSSERSNEMSMEELSSDLSADLSNELSADLSHGNDLLGDALSMDDLDRETFDRVASVDDLTLDLDQLSDELDLDSSELMNPDLSDLELPDLTVDADLMMDNVGVGDSSDEMDTMMDLAKAYIDMGDKDSASSALDEIVKSGSPEQVTEAETLLRKIS